MIPYSESRCQGKNARHSIFHDGFLSASSVSSQNRQLFHIPISFPLHNHRKYSKHTPPLKPLTHRMSADSTTFARHAYPAGLPLPSIRLMRLPCASVNRYLHRAHRRCSLARAEFGKFHRRAQGSETPPPPPTRTAVPRRLSAPPMSLRGDTALSREGHFRPARPAPSQNKCASLCLSPLSP